MNKNIKIKHSKNSNSTFNLESLEFHRAGKDDAHFLEKLYQQLTNDSNVNVLPETIESIQSDVNQILLVIKYGGIVIGSAFVVIARDVMYRDQPFALIENIIIDSQFRKIGVGSKLMNYIKSICKLRNCTKIMFLSSSKRTDAHHFFETHGYRGDLKKGFVNYINRN